MISWLIENAAHGVISVMVIIVLVGALTSIRGALLRWSMEERRQLPWAVGGLALALCAVLYGVLAIRQLVRSNPPLPHISSLPLEMVIELNLWYAGFLLLAVPAGYALVIAISFRRSAARLLARDRRPPVLLLRSFEGDESVGSRSREAEDAVSKCPRRRMGSLVAIGSPQDFHPPGGAAREYVDDDEWEQMVLEMLAKSAAVVFLLSRYSEAIA